MSAPGEVINNKFTGTTSVDIGLNEAGVTVTGNTFNNTPSQGYFFGNGSLRSEDDRGQQLVPQSGRDLHHPERHRQDGVYSSIQAAIDAAIPGDTVFVGNGTYNENVALVDGVNVEGQSEAGVIINGTISTPVDFDNTTVSNLTVNDSSSTAMLLDMTATQEVTSSPFSNITLNLETNSTEAQLIGNGQVANDIALSGSGLTFSGVTMNTNDYVAGSTAFAYTLFHSVGGAQLTFDDVSLKGDARVRFPVQITGGSMEHEPGRQRTCRGHARKFQHQRRRQLLLSGLTRPWSRTTPSTVRASRSTA